MRTNNNRVYELLALALSDSQPLTLSTVPPAFLREVRRQGLAPLLERRAFDGLLAFEDPETQKQLHDVTLRLAAQDMAQNQAARLVLALLASHGHPSLLLKGTAMAHLHYPSSWLRPRTDVDIWVRESELMAIANTLSRRGYSVLNLEPGRVGIRQFQATREAFAGQPIWLDIHYRISNRALFRDALDFETCLERCQPVPRLRLGSSEVGGRDARLGTDLPPQAMALSNPDLFMHAAMHRIAHGRNRDPDYLLWLYDIHLLTHALDQSELDLLVDAALAQGIGTVCADALRSSRSALGTPVPEALLNLLESRSNYEPSARLLQAGRWPWLWSDFRYERRWSNRLRLATELLGRRFS